MAFNINPLKQICNASESNTEKVVYSTDSSCIEGKLLAIAWPENLDQLQKLIRFAFREKISLVPRGGGTSLVGGCVPQESIVVDLSRLNKIKRLVLSEKTVVADAGVYLDNLNSSISKYNLEFPVKPGSHAACTIGGMISTNAAGLLSKKFGKTEDWIEEISVMDGNGRLFAFSRNEAKEFVGTEGCCGFIVEAKLKLSEISNNFSTDLLSFENLDEMGARLEQLNNDADVIALEYINPVASKIVGMPVKEHLIVKYSNERGKLAPDEAERIWKMRENMYSILVNAGFNKIEDPFFETTEKSSSISGVPETSGVSKQGIIRFLDWVNKQNVPCYGHIGYGIVHPHFKLNEDIGRMADAVKELNGRLAGEHGVGLLKKRYAPLMISTRIKELKSRYDPNNIMNRGKVI